MEDEKRAYILNIGEIIDFVFNDYADKNSDSEINEIYTIDDDTKNLSLTTKQIREVKSDEMTNCQTVRYDLMKMLIDRLLNMDDNEITFGDTIVINTMLSEGLITEVK
jgi:hypothetical protein